tara:strand:- start:272 stop:505 length:234 start_codon:yes stop_codon:yes gene_type:complete
LGLFSPAIASDRHFMPQVIGRLAFITCDRHRLIGFPQTAQSMNRTPSRIRFAEAAFTALSVRIDPTAINIDTATAPF